MESICDDDLKKIYQVLKKECKQSQHDQLLIRINQSSADTLYQTEKYSDGFSNYAPHEQNKGKDQYEFGNRSNWDTASPSRYKFICIYSIKKEEAFNSFYSIVSAI